MKNHYDIIVVGGGHAGVEASHICAKLGLQTLLITHLIDNIALASCNPAIGGLGKGHLVKEVDSLGGLMGAITDISGLQYRILNASKGPAVRGTRAQIDMDLYRKYARDLLLHTKNLHIIQGNVIKILSCEGKATGIELSIKKQFFAQKIIITAGTFLKGLIHIGENKSENGRAGEAGSNELSDSLKELGIPLARLKTGTCPRILGASINSNNLEKHFGDAQNKNLSNKHLEEKFNDNTSTATTDTHIIKENEAPYFSLLTHEYLLHRRENIITKFLSSRLRDGYFMPEELPCFVTYTNIKTHALIESNFYRAPLFTGQIQGVGPRYCPSIEDKINRFKDKTRHQLFLEPQTYSKGEYYINGLSTSLPYEVQEEVIHSIEGLENAVITRYGYAIEYDYSQPTNLYHTLESKIIQSLYLAGQINGTTGYEEAAAQGIMAGINASLSILHKQGKTQRESLILERHESYIGVMIDDLVTKGTNEPYRVFTSRAEYRLLLREDNACYRMLPYARELKLLSKEILDELSKEHLELEQFLAILTEDYTPSKINLEKLQLLGEEKFSNKCHFGLILGRDSMNPEKIRSLDSRFAQASDRVLQQVQILAKYHDYIQKQATQIKRSEHNLHLEIPKNFEYNGISGLSLEVIEKLSKEKPKTLREAKRISGITPASLEVLELHIALHKKKDKQKK